MMKLTLGRKQCSDMNLQETQQVLRVLRVNYKRHFEGMTKEDSEIILNTWFQIFKDDCVELVSLAIQKVIMESRFCPTIAEIKDKMFELSVGKQDSAVDCFRLVKKAIRRDSSMAKREYDKLPLETQLAIGDYKNLCEYANMSDDDIQKYIFPRFRDSLAQVRETRKEMFKASDAMIQTSEKIAIDFQQTDDLRTLTISNRQLLLD